MNKSELKRALKSAFPHTIPILTGFLILGMAYGVLMQTKGYGALWSVIMSAIAFCGSMQFVAITLLTTGLDFVLTALFVVLFIEQLSSKINAISGIIGLACTVVALNIFGADNLVIPSMIMIVLVIILMRKKLDIKQESIKEVTED